MGMLSGSSRLPEFSFGEKCAITGFLLLLGLGYLFAVANIFVGFRMADGEAGMSVQDIRIHFNGDPTKTRLMTALQGSMMDYVDGEEQTATIGAWIAQGKDQEVFREKVNPILESNCVECHSPEGDASLPSFTSFDDVLKVAEPDHGVSIPRLIQSSHIHLFAMGLVFFCLAGIFSLSGVGSALKTVLLAAPFVFILLDVGSWWLTKLAPGFGFLVILAGAGLGVSFACQFFISLYEIWRGEGATSG
ncbi:MAG: hypothetical protein V1800_07445 [Candidatus Latescibacterota bacterium]